MHSPRTNGRRKGDEAVSDVWPRVDTTALAKAIAHGAPIVAVLSALILIGAYQALAQTETVLHSFGWDYSGDGMFPPAGVIFDKHGRLVGTTQAGGTVDYGTVFAVFRKGRDKVLYSFGGEGQPFAGLVRDKVGNLYGTTENGAVFELTVGGTESVLYRLGSQAGDGTYPLAGLVFDKQGNLYGTTFFGGAYSFGTVFKVTPDGTETVLYSFGSQPGDGGNPAARLVFDKQGNLYGTASVGGAYGFGTVFKLTPSGTETVLYSFGSQSGDGTYPLAGLLVDKHGNLYGTTTGGGNGGCWGNGCGTVFKMTPTGTETVLYAFGSQSGDGSYPWGDLVFDKQGNLYGTTYYDGAYGNGAVFKLTQTGTETVLYSFAGGADGSSPIGGLVFDKKGNLYGTTYVGGVYGHGTVFKLSP